MSPGLCCLLPPPAWLYQFRTFSWPCLTLLFFPLPPAPFIPPLPPRSFSPLSLAHFLTALLPLPPPFHLLPPLLLFPVLVFHSFPTPFIHLLRLTPSPLPSPPPSPLSTLKPTKHVLSFVDRKLHYHTFCILQRQGHGLLRTSAEVYSWKKKIRINYNKVNQPHGI